MCVFLPHFPSFSWSSQASSLGPSHLGHSHERVPGCQSPRCHLMGWCGQNSPLFFLCTPSRDLNSFFQQQGPCPYITNTGETICQPRTEELRWQLIFAASVDLKRPVFSPLRSSLLWTRPACSESLRAGSFQVPYTQRTFSNTGTVGTSAPSSSSMTAPRWEPLTPAQLSTHLSARIRTLPADTRTSCVQKIEVTKGSKNNCADVCIEWDAAVNKDIL